MPLLKQDLSSLNLTYFSRSLAFDIDEFSTENAGIGEEITYFHLILKQYTFNLKFELLIARYSIGHFSLFSLIKRELSSHL